VPTTSRNPRPVIVTRHDADMACDVRRVVGYAGRCEICGEQTRTCSTIRIARLALDMHRLAEHR
jgi:hypothetical protein